MNNASPRLARIVLSSVDLVYEQTRAAIVNGDYPPGSALKIQDLATANSVSLTPVREALRLLAAEGFVEAVRNRSARVASLSGAEVAEIHSLRVLLETEALRRAFPRITPAVIARLWELNTDLIEQLGRSDDRFIATHEAMHFMIYELSNSKWLIRIIRLLWAHSERHRWLACPPGKEPLDERAHHVELLMALDGHDRQRALGALKAHIEHNLGMLLEASGGQRGPNDGAQDKVAPA